jgi:hypothetical protein
LIESERRICSILGNDEVKREKNKEFKKEKKVKCVDVIFSTKSARGESPWWVIHERRKTGSSFACDR